MTQNYAKQLEEAARMTQKLVKGLFWLEREGPTNGRLLSISQDLTRLAGEFEKAIDKDLDHRQCGTELERLRTLYGVVQAVVTRCIEARCDLHLRIHVLDCLEKIGPEPPRTEGPSDG